MAAKLAVLIKEFAQRQQLGDMAVDGDGRYTLTFDDALQVQCFERFELIHIVSVLGELPKQKGEVFAWLQRLLNYSLTRMKRDMATPSIDEDNRLILFERFASGPANVHDFEERLERYVNTLDEYQRFLARPARTGASVPRGMVFTP